MKDSLGGLDLVRIFLGRISPRKDLFLSEGSIVVEVELGIHGEHLMIRRLGQWVDLNLGGVLLHEELVELLDGLGGFL